RLSRKYDEADDVDRAISLLRGASREYPQEYALHSQLGDLYRIDEQYRAAIASYSRAIDLLPEVTESRWPIFYARGIAYERSDQWPRAEADFQKALELRPNQPFVLNYLGYSWADQGVRLVEAEDMIRRAVNLRPNDGFIVDSLGWVLYRLGRYDEAVGYLERAVALSPNDQVINDHLGDALWRVGRRVEAGFQWQRAIDIGTDDEVTAAARTKLENGITTPPTIPAPPPTAGPALELDPDLNPEAAGDDQNGVADEPDISESPATRQSSSISEG
ncbi:MAG: tetratricopeptide repeat protein, partial [Pseudomonadota bacterium]